MYMLVCTTSRKKREAQRDAYAYITKRFCYVRLWVYIPIIGLYGCTTYIYDCYAQNQPVGSANIFNISLGLCLSMRLKVSMSILGRCFKGGLMATSFGLHPHVYVALLIKDSPILSSAI